MSIRATLDTRAREPGTTGRVSRLFMRAAREAPLDVAIIGEMPPRITLIEPADAPILARPLYSPTGETSPITRALAQVPELLGPTMGFLGPVLAPGSIDLRTKELVILRVSAVAECAYCTGAHTVAAADAGVNAVEREALIGMAPLEQAFDGEDLRLLHLCDAIAAGGGVDGTLVASVRRDRGDHGVVELVLLACATLMLNRLCTTLELPLTHATAERLAAVMEEIA